MTTAAVEPQLAPRRWPARTRVILVCALVTAVCCFLPWFTFSVDLGEDDATRGPVFQLTLGRSLKGINTTEGQLAFAFAVACVTLLWVERSGALRARVPLLRLGSLIASVLALLCVLYFLLHLRSIAPRSEATEVDQATEQLGTSIDDIRRAVLQAIGRDEEVAAEPEPEAEESLQTGINAGYYLAILVSALAAWQSVKRLRNRPP